MTPSPVSKVFVPLASVLALAAGCTGSESEDIGTTAAALTGQSIATLALANVGEGACSANSEGGTAFDSSCTGNGGQPEYWCADFARWVWAAAGASNTSELTAAAGSFYVFGQNHGTLHSTPAVGDAVVFDYQGGGVADHVALVTQANSNGTIETVSGDWDGQSGSEAYFSSTSHVVLNAPAYPDGQGTSPGIMGMTISGYISAIGVSGTAPYGAAYVTQSFPLASTALTLFAGQTVAASITLKNVGSKSWDSNTRLGTTQPRDRASAFADSSWLAANRPAAVSGSIAPGATYKFDFNFHAPSKPGTYLEYFGVVEEGVAWFSDSGQGGPPDNDLEAQLVVVAGGPGDPDGGIEEGDAAVDDAAASVGPPEVLDAQPSQGPHGGAEAGRGPAETAGHGTSGAGCSLVSRPSEGPRAWWLLAAGVAGVACLLARRRRDAQR